ncbi:hypothetical protein IJT17_03470 [bacterium]|nr:hypothetical protein [bacterium]
MDTGELNDYTYYNGYEGYPEFILSSGDKSMHIWDGYLEDIFGEPPLDGQDWYGLTKDFHEDTGPFDSFEPCPIDVEAYLSDAISCRGRKMRFEESPAVLEAMISWLSAHKDAEVFAVLD